MKRLTYIMLVLAWPSFWNACGNVNFQTGDGSFKSCSERGANLANCFNIDAQSLKNMSQSVNVSTSNQIDILFVVDNSGSMAEEQVNIGAKIDGFLDLIRGLDWQIALTTTDPNSKTKITGMGVRPRSDGQLRPLDSNTGSQFILKAGGQSDAEAQTMLAKAIEVGIAGSGDERGIYATYRAIERAANPGANRDLLRPNAKLAVILISDEDECSTGLADCPAATAAKSVPQNLIDLVRTSLGFGKGIAFNSIVQIPDDETCETGSNRGHVYKEISQLTGGVMTSVCSSDYTTALNLIGNRVVQLVSSATLDCTPADLTGDGQPDVQVNLADGRIMNGGFTVAGANVSFADALPEGQHTFHYFCKY